MDEVIKPKKTTPLAKIQIHLEQPKHRLIAIGTVIFLVIVVIFL
jgi:hypothetical protein